jgi:hypothetical protein
LAISLADVSKWGAPAWAAVGSGAALVALQLTWHARHAFRTLPRPSFWCYLALRCAIFGFFGLVVGATTSAYASGHELRTAHLHHLYIAWALASCAQFNHPISGALLALAAGIFVQGAGAYGFDPLVVPAGCKNVTLPSSMARGIAVASGCRWSDELAGGVVRMRVCPADQASLAVAEFMRCSARRMPGFG